MLFSLVWSWMHPKVHQYLANAVVSCASMVVGDIACQYIEYKNM